MATQAIEMSKPTPEIMEKVLVVGDLMKLTPTERVSYYGHVCHSLGLNPLTKPFEYIVLNGKLTLYARKDCTDQLRKLHEVSVDAVDHQYQDAIGIYVVTAQGHDSKGRKDTGTGAVFVQGLKGDSLANAIMKAETKAKRRLTLSLCGLGMLDETEIESIPDAQEFTENSAPEPIRKTTPKVQGEVVSPAAAASPFGTEVVSDKQLKLICTVQSTMKVSDDDFKKWLGERGIISRKLIPKKMMNETLEYLDPKFSVHTKPDADGF